jgi:4-hydroxybenzoate polyprenyltransferase/geranylgeranylglycerol-phosphate geranylgeranyltransferase
MTKKPKKVPLKVKLYAHFEAWRVYSLLWSGIVSLLGACVAIGDFPSFKVSLLVFIIPVFGWISGLYAMDYLDRKLDLIEKPNRPIPSGRIKPKEAIICACIFAGMGLFLSLLLNIINIFIVFLIAITVITYTSFSKARGILQNLNRGLITWTTFFFGYFAITQNVPMHNLLFSFVFFFHDASTNIIGALRDIKGDKKGGYKTTPVRYGVTNALLIALVFSTIFLSIILYSIFKTNIIIFLDKFSIIFILALICIIALYSIGFYFRKNLDRKKALIIHSLFVSERVILACAFIIGIAKDFYLALTIFIIVAPATAILQILLRKQYELIIS